MQTQLDALLIVEFHDENLSRKDWLGGPGQALHGGWRWIQSGYAYFKAYRQFNMDNDRAEASSGAA